MEVEMSASRSCRFSTGKKARSTHRIGGCVGPRADLDAMAKRISLYLPVFETQADQPVA